MIDAALAKRDRDGIARAVLYTVSLLIAALPAAGDPLSEWADLNARAVDQFNQGDYIDAAPLADSALAHAARHLGRETEQYATSALLMCKIDWQNGRLDVAERSCTDAVTVRERVLGADHEQTADAMLELALVYDSTWREADAVALERKALHIFEETHGPDDLTVAQALTNIGSALLDLYDYEGASQALTRAAAIRESQNAPPRRLANTFHLLGMSEVGLGKYAEAEEHFKKGLDIQERALPPGDPDIGSSLNSLASMYDDQGAYDRALPLYLRALAIWEEYRGPNHPDVALALTNIGSLYNDIREYQNAEPYLLRGLRIRKNILGASSPDLAVSHRHLSTLYTAKGEPSKALEHAREALEIDQARAGPNSVDAARSMVFLAEVYFDTGDYELALETYQRSLQLHEELLGPDHEWVASVHGGIGYAYLELGDLGAAADAFEQKLAISAKVFGENHLRTVQALSSLAGVYQEQERLADAQGLLERSLASLREQGTADHEELSSTLNRLGVLSYQQGNKTAAESYYLQSLAVRDEAGTLADDDAAFALYNLGSLYLELERIPEAIRFLEQALSTMDDALAGTPDRTLAGTLTELATAYVASGRTADAAQLARRAVNIYAELDGAEASTTVEMRGHLATLLFDLRQYTEARDEYAELLRVFRKLTGGESLGTAKIEVGLGVVYLVMEDPRRSEPLLQHAVEVFEMDAEANAALLRRTLLALAVLYEATDRKDQADVVRKRADALQETQRPDATPEPRRDPDLA